MRKQLGTLFNKVVHAAKKPVIAIVGTLSLAFAPSVAQEQQIQTPPETPYSPTYTYWRYGDYDIVAKVWETEDNKIAAAIHSANPDDPDNKKLMAMLKGYGTPEKRSIGKNQSITVLKPAPDMVEDWEITSYIGFEPDLETTKKNDKKWKGKITSPFNQKTYGLDIEKLSDNELKLSGYLTGFSLIKLSFIAERVPDPTLPPPENVAQKGKAPKLS